MGPSLLLAAVLVGPITPSESASPAPVGDLRAEYTALMRQFADRSRPEPSKIVPPLCELHERVERDAELSHAARHRMIRGIEHRLVEMHERMLRGQRNASLAGGAANRAAAELIRLIETTVAPETWASNGGRGTINYWSRNPALVIRQTTEVHHQVGRTLEAMR